MKLRLQGSPGLTEASKSFTVSPPLAANNAIEGSLKFINKASETVTAKGGRVKSVRDLAVLGEVLWGNRWQHSRFGFGNGKPYYNG